jgi:hypothetical protein
MDNMTEKMILILTSSFRLFFIETLAPLLSVLTILLIGFLNTIRTRKNIRADSSPMIGLIDSNQSILPDSVTIDATARKTVEETIFHLKMDL